MPLRPLILLSNDDGYSARGLNLLAQRLRQDADVVICAPEAEQSATSHSLTLTRPLRLRSVERDVFALDGTPADCVYVALNAGTKVLPRRPDLVVSGMNHGLNLGSDVFYSGTVAAAREGALRGILALAASADPAADQGEAAGVCAQIALGLLSVLRKTTGDGAIGVPDPTAPAALLNVNVPPGRGWQVVAARLGRRIHDDLIDFRVDPMGREYLWLGGGGVRHGHWPGSDTEAYDRGDVSITPLRLDLTAESFAGLASRVAAAVLGP